MHQKAGGADNSRAGKRVNQQRVALWIISLSRYPFFGRVPFQYPATGVHADIEAVVARSYCVPLAHARMICPLVSFRNVVEKAHRESSAAGDRAVWSSCHSHQMRTFTGVIEGDLGGLVGFGILDYQLAFREIADTQNLTIREIAMEQTLMACDVALPCDILRLGHPGGLALVQLKPRIIASGTVAGIHLAVFTTVDCRRSLYSLVLRQNRCDFTGFRVQSHNLTGCAADSQVYPAPVIGNY